MRWKGGNRYGKRKIMHAICLTKRALWFCRVEFVTPTGEVDDLRRVKGYSDAEGRTIRTIKRVIERALGEYGTVRLDYQTQLATTERRVRLDNDDVQDLNLAMLRLKDRAMIFADDVDSGDGVRIAREYPEYAHAAPALVQGGGRARVVVSLETTPFEWLKTNWAARKSWSMDDSTIDLVLEVSDALHADHVIEWEPGGEKREPTVADFDEKANPKPKEEAKSPNGKTSEVGEKVGA